MNLSLLKISTGIIKSQPRIFRTKGFSLIEVLIALLVMAIGLLGMAALQTTSLRSSGNTIHRSAATYLAYSLLDRIKSNPTVDYSIGESSPPPSIDCLSARCSKGEIALFDLANWKCALGSYDGFAVCQNLSVNGVLPQGRGEVQKNGSSYTVTISWYNDQSGTRDSFDYVSVL